MSAGTDALVGHPMPDPSIEIASRLGLEHPEQHRGQLLTKELVEESDLVITMAREHRSRVVRLFPRANRYTYTLVQLARIAAAISDDELEESVSGRRAIERAALRTLSELRGSAPIPESQEELDILDPYRREMEVYEQSSAAIVEAVDTVVGFFDRALRFGPGA